jgi:hypothetical protein
VPEREGDWTKLLPGGQVMRIFDASEHYQHDGTPLLIIAGKEYGSGSSRDWAAKGTLLLGVKAVIAESYERRQRVHLHRRRPGRQPDRSAVPAARRNLADGVAPDDAPTRMTRW